MTSATGDSATFKVGLVQLRSGLEPAANVDVAAKLIREAKAAGADYIQTPEVTNLFALNRDRLFAAIVPEEEDASLAAFRDLARSLSVMLHVGSLAIQASPDRAANRSTDMLEFGSLQA